MFTPLFGGFFLGGLRRRFVCVFCSVRGGGARRSSGAATRCFVQTALIRFEITSEHPLTDLVSSVPLDHEGGRREG